MTIAVDLGCKATKQTNKNPIDIFDEGDALVGVSISKTEHTCPHFMHW